MPKFKGITVTINPTYDRDSTGPFREYGTITQKRANRITSYIPSTSNTPFAVSIIMDDDYQPLTTLANESLAAYLYFDGRKQEETATLLRRGSETWISSRWVTMGNGELAEKEFYFKEIGLEVFLNSLDIKKDKNGDKRGSHSSDEEEEGDGKTRGTAGQIRVDLYRVVPEGPVRKGEYKPMFTENDNEDVEDGEKNAADLEHTAGFGEPKPLFKEAISVQSVSHLDAESAPYASFIFFYRGERQLQKMGIMPRSKSTPKTPATSTPASPIKDALSPKERRKSGFKSFGDLASEAPDKPGQKNLGKSFGGFRSGNNEDGDDDADEERGEREDTMEEDDDVPRTKGDEKVEKELTKGVKKMNLKRSHTDETGAADPDYHDPSATSTRNGTPSPTASGVPPLNRSNSLDATPKQKRYSVGGRNASDTSSLDSSAFSPAKRRRESRAIDFSSAAALGFGGAGEEVL